MTLSKTLITSALMLNGCASCEKTTAPTPEAQSIIAPSAPTTPASVRQVNTRREAIQSLLTQACSHVMKPIALGQNLFDTNAGLTACNEEKTVIAIAGCDDQNFADLQSTLAYTLANFSCTGRIPRTIDPRKNPKQLNDVGQYGVYALPFSDGTFCARKVYASGFSQLQEMEQINCVGLRLDTTESVDVPGLIRQPNIKVIK